MSTSTAPSTSDTGKPSEITETKTSAGSSQSDSKNLQSNSPFHKLSSRGQEAIILKIFHYLPPRDQIELGNTCKLLHRISWDPELPRTIYVRPKNKKDSETCCNLFKEFEDWTGMLSRIDLSKKQTRNPDLVTDNTIELLATHIGKNLTYLWIGTSVITSRALSLLAEHCPNIETLGLHESEVLPMSVLCRVFSMFPKLQMFDLNLWSKTIDLASFKDLLASPRAASPPPQTPSINLSSSSAAPTDTLSSISPRTSKFLQNTKSVDSDVISTISTRTSNIRQINLVRLTLAEPCRHCPKLSHLTGLSRLVIRNCRPGLLDLPDDIGQLINLEYLDVSHNSLTALPDSLCKCINLNHLDISRNNIVSLPEDIGNLKRVSVIIMGFNEITQLPASIVNCSNLWWLQIDTLQITQLPLDIGKLKKLYRITCYNCPLTSIPDSIGDCVSLNLLWAARCRLTEIPSSIGRLQNLCSLWLDHNFLQTIPKEISKCSKLRRLTLNGNPITSLPSELKVLGLFRPKDPRGFPGLSLKDTTISERIPNEILEDGIVAVINWLENNQPPPAEPADPLEE